MNGAVAAGRWLEVTAELLERPVTRFPHELAKKELRATFEVRAVSWEWAEGSRAGHELDMPIPDELARHHEHAFVDHPLVEWFTASADPSPQTIARVPAAAVTVGDLQRVGLTGRESAVLALAATGLTTVAIARRLGIAPGGRPASTSSTSTANSGSAIGSGPPRSPSPWRPRGFPCRPDPGLQSRQPPPEHVPEPARRGNDLPSHNLHTSRPR